MYLKSMLDKINDKLFFLLVCYGLFLRVFLALSGDFLFVPDEVMQYLEQGHRIVYGYGLIPWEYRLGIRPLIIPYFIAFWLKNFAYLGLSQPTSYIPAIKIVFCILSMSIPLGMYQFCKSNYSNLAGYIALFLGCSWYEFIITAHKPLSEIFSTEIMFIGIYFFNRTSPKALYLGTLLSCLAIAVRPHLAPVITIILFYYYYKKPKSIIVNGLTAIAISVLLIGFFDYSTLGSPWIGYFLYFYYNIVVGIAPGFGAEPMYTYLWVFLVTSVGLFYVSIFYVFQLESFKENSLPFFSILIILALHSLIPHKEYRFIYSIIPFWLIIFSSYLSNLKFNNRAYSRTFVIVSIISGLGLNGLLPKQQLAISLSNSKEGSYFKCSDSLNAYLYLSTIKNKGAIFDYTNIWPYSGGYYYLHRKVPLFHSEVDYKNNSEALHKIYLDMVNNSVKYIVTYEKITLRRVMLIKNYGQVKIYEVLDNGVMTEMSRYDFNRYIPNLPL